MGDRHKGVETEWHGPMDAVVTVATPERDHLSGAEIGAAIEALSSGDKLKLAAIDDRMRGGTGLGRGDLVQEAVLRALDVSRKCPRSVSFMAFLVESMRSIAGHERAKNRRNVSLTEVGEALNASVLDPAILPRNAEDGLIDKQESAVVQTIHAEFNDDPEAQLVLMGWMDALRGAAMLEATGLNQGQFDYAAKRIRTKMRRLYPQGWHT
jgi:DNA-directed RNA polymerase specialized sigma24 family protein